VIQSLARLLVGGVSEMQVGAGGTRLDRNVSKPTLGRHLLVYVQEQKEHAVYMAI